MRKTKETTQLCGEPYDPQDLASPRCVVAKNAHAGRKHEAVGQNGEALLWGTAPPAQTP